MVPVAERDDLVGSRDRVVLEVAATEGRAVITNNIKDFRPLALGYQAGPDVTGLLAEPDLGEWTRWTAPMSLRDVEPEVLLQLAAADHSLDDAPAWRFGAEAAP